MARLGWIGLGGAGAGLAARLAAAGHALTVYDRDRARAEAWVAAHGGRLAASPAEAATGAGCVLLHAGSEADARAQALGPKGAVVGLARGALVIDQAAVSPALAAEIAAAVAARGARAVEMRLMEAARPTGERPWMAMAGGAAADIEAARALVGRYADPIVHVGPMGHAATARLVAETMTALSLEAFAECVHFLRTVGHDMERVFGLMEGSSANSWVLRTQARRMAAGDTEGDGGVARMIDALGLALAEARRFKVPAPGTAVVQQFLVDLDARGRGGADGAALIERLGTLGGKTR